MVVLITICFSCKIFDEDDYYLNQEPRDRCDRGEEMTGDYTPGWKEHIPDSSHMDEDNILEQESFYQAFRNSQFKRVY